MAKASEVQEQDNDRLTLVLQDNYAATDTQETMVITDDKSLRKFFSRINRTRKPGIPVPQVDFSKELILIHCAGEQHGNGMPMLTMLNETKEEIVIGMGKTQKKSEKGSTATTRPFSVYKMPLTKKEITFKTMN
ncbi:hypothetical protein FK220_017200 [Flavobacteriaceae bacterium TP-CH-4]|uniref:Uncharacterized protein n=1 Tax=Pelagihabitans pacificus TaxID=2696054 RepID=A0A967B0Y2_9FLAO|nr:hypothetical protein [Pelagihabitans pacificus]NHF61092.1 hypothetical protein [Pelagihabitans pacificus]